MPSTFSPSLRLELIGNGEQAGNWGNTTNTNLGTLLEQAITGVENIALPNSDYTLLLGNGVPDQSRNAVLVLTGTLTAARNVICPSVEKVYLVRNQTVGGFAITIRTASGTGVQVANGSNTWVYCDGTNVLAGGPGFNPATNAVSGTMETATRWATARQLTIAGDASGSLVAPWDGSTDATLNITIPGLQQAGVQSLRLAATTPRTGAVTITESDTVNILLGGNVVRTFQGVTTRTGNITLTGGDVTWALGYTPVASFNGRTGNVVLSATDVTSALGATAVQNAVSAQSAVTALNFSGNISGSQVLGNISGNAGNITGTVNIANGGTGATTAANARAALGAASTGANTFTGAQTATEFVITNGLNIGPASITFQGAQESVFTQSSQVQIAAGGTARLRVAFTNVTSLVRIDAPGYATRTGTSGTSSPINNFNISWTNNNTATLWIDDQSVAVLATTSDRRLKHQISDLPSATSVVMALRPVSYRWQDNGLISDDGEPRWGFIADEVQAVLPSAVVGDANAVDENGRVQSQHIVDRPIIAALTKALQEALQRIEALEAAR